MAHLLDNPAWNALNTGNARFALGDDEVRFFDKEVSPFAAFKVNDDAHFEQLREMLPHPGPILFVRPDKMDTPKGWKILACITGHQMVCEGEMPDVAITADLVTLDESHVPQMLELTRLTNPGPFAQRTIEFGYYQGIFENGRLVAMTGQRLHAGNYTEASAVCTHPDHNGKGYARQLLAAQVMRMKAAGNIPFLHVKYGNDRAIKLYESLGFAPRIEVSFYFMTKE